MRHLLVAFALLPLAGCAGEEPVACTEIAIASVIVNVSTADGADAAIEVTYSADGVDAAVCDSFGDPGQYVCGYEVAGEVEVEVAAEGYEPQVLTVTVEETEDGCHVVTETVDVVLEPMPVE